MSTLKVQNLQHPDSPEANIVLFDDGSVSLASTTLELGDLADVNEGAGATDGQVLTYDEMTGEWVPAPPSGAVDSVNGQTGVVTLTTTNISEGATNFYYTNARVDTRVGQLLPSTDSLSEGSTNLYYTNARADARIAAANIDALANVNTVGVADGNVLTYQSGSWVADVGGGGGADTNEILKATFFFQGSK
jgi:hypothetical protein